MCLILLDPGIRRDDKNGLNQSVPRRSNCQVEFRLPHNTYRDVSIVKLSLWPVKLNWYLLRRLAYMVALRIIDSILS